MAISGNLKTFYLSSLLQLLSNDKKTGILELTDGHDIVQVYLREGTIINAFGSSRVDRLTNYLRSEGIITEEQLQKCMKISAHTEKKIGMVLVEQGFLSPEQLEILLHRQIEQTLFSLFLWDQGEFQYRDQNFDLSGQIITSFDTMQVVLEASRRVDEISELKKRVPPDHDVLTINPNCSNKQKTKLNTVERAVLSLVNAKRTVKRVIADSGYDELKVYKTLFSLVTSGLILEENTILKRPNDIREELTEGGIAAASSDDALQRAVQTEKHTDDTAPISAITDPEITAKNEQSAQHEEHIIKDKPAESACDIFNTPADAKPGHDQDPAEPDEMILELDPEPDIAEQLNNELPSVPEAQKNQATLAAGQGKTIVKINDKIIPEIDFSDIGSGSTAQIEPVKKSEIADAFRQRGLEQNQATSARLQISLEEDLTKDEEEEYAREKKRLLKKILVGAGAVLALIVVVLLLKPILFPGETEQKPVQAPITVPKSVKKKKPVKQETQKPASQEEKKAVPDTMQPEPESEFFQDQKGWVSINLPTGFTVSEQSYQDRTSVRIEYGNDVTIALSIVPKLENWNAEDNMYATIVKMQENGIQQIQEYSTLKHVGCPGYVLHFADMQDQKPTQTALYRFVCFNKSARLEVNSFNMRTPAGRELSQCLIPPK